MAVDANILIFERIREELGKGKSLLHSMSAGYQRAFFDDSQHARLLFGVPRFYYGQLVRGAARYLAQVISAGPAAFKSAVSYGERLMEFTAEKRARYTVKRDFMPNSFHRGVIVAALGATDARNVKVEATDPAFMETIYEISWE